MTDMAASDDDLFLADHGKTVLFGRLRIGVALVTALGMTILLLPLHGVLLLAGKARFGSIAPRIWHSTVSRALGFHVRVTGTYPAARPLLIVANHVSWTDIPVLGGTVNAAFVAKADMQEWPGIRWLARMARTVFVEREKRSRSGAQAGEIAMRLGAGEAMILFAEGTTGDGNVLLPFKSSLLAAAQKTIEQTGAPLVYVLPVALAYTRIDGMPAGRQGQTRLSWIGDQDLVPHLADVVAQGGFDVEVMIGEPVAFTAQSNRKAVTREIEARVRAMLLALHRGRQG